MADITPKLAEQKPSIRTITGATILFMVVVRILIGWHFFYEGAWKLVQPDWKATPFLVQSAGPMEGIFRSMVKDETGLEALTKGAALAHLDETYQKMLDLYKPDAEQMKGINMVLEEKRWYVRSLFATGQDRVEDYEKIAIELADMEQPIAELKEQMDGLKKTIEQAGKDPNQDANYRKTKEDLFTLLRKQHVLNGARGGLIWNMNDRENPDVKARLEAYDKLILEVYNTPESDQNGPKCTELKEAKAKLQAELAPIFGESDFRQELEVYEHLLARIDEEGAKKGQPDFHVERLQDLRMRKAKMKAGLLATARAGSKDLPTRTPIGAGRFLTEEQLKAGPLPPDQSPTEWIDWANMLALTAVGACLMLGLFTRLASFGGICLLMMYYWAMPALPGLPENPSSEGHYLYVNKNLIEAAMLLVLMTTRIGRWGGLDAYFCARGCRKETACRITQQDRDTAVGRLGSTGK